MKSEDARLHFKNSILTYADVDKQSLQRLRNLINREMIISGCMDRSLRCRQIGQFGNSLGRMWAGIRCRSHYFDDREVVSFNPDGFIGFAGLASSENAMPILQGFKKWVCELDLNKRIEGA